MQKLELKLEVCVDSYESLIKAKEAGADRIELCSALFAGGLSPSSGLLQLASEIRNLDINVMVRPRVGDFLYSDAEFTTMLKEIELIKALGFNGIVVGILKSDGSVDKERMKTIIQATNGLRLRKPLQITFHRAFDNGINPRQMMDNLIELGVDSLLTSGQKGTAIEGSELIAELEEEYGKLINIIVGAGVTDKNILALYNRTKCREYHMSAKMFTPSRMNYEMGVGEGSLPIPQEEVWQVDSEIICRTKEIMRKIEENQHD